MKYNEITDKKARAAIKYLLKHGFIKFKIPENCPNKIKTDEPKAGAMSPYWGCLSCGNFMGSMSGGWCMMGG